MCVVTFDFEENDAIEKVKNFKKKKTLSWVVLEITDACNINCLWCYANAGYAIKRPRKHMPFENLKKVLKLLLDAGVKQITFSGGEPTIYPRIKDAIKTAKDMGFVVHINTNGYVLTKDLIREFKYLGLSQIQTNIDSINPVKHDFIRGMPGSFEKAVRCLKNASEVGITAVSQTVLTNLNEKEVIDIFRLARDLGVHRCRVWDMTPSEGMAKMNINLAPTDYLKTLENLYEYGIENGLKRIETGDPLFPLERKLSVEVTGGFCVSYHGASTTISPHGDVFYCATYRKPLYNVFQDEIEVTLDKFHKERLSEFIKREIDLPPPCKKCAFSETCAGSCIVRRSANPFSIDTFCRFIQVEKTIPRNL